MRIAGVAISEVRGRHPGADEEWVAQLLASASVSTASGPSEADYVDDHGDSFNWTYVAVYGWRTDTSNPASKLSTTAAKPPAKKQRPNASAYFATTRHGAQPRVVRREWLKIFVSRKSAPKGAQRFIFSELAFGGFQLCDAMEKHHRFGCDLLDVSDAGALSATFKNAGDARAQMITLALVLGAHEAELGVHTWRSRNRAAERYLSQIASWGYDLSEIEQFVIKDNSDDESPPAIPHAVVSARPNCHARSCVDRGNACAGTRPSVSMHRR